MRKCLGCGAKFDHHDDLMTDDQPVDGNASVCLHCGKLQVFEGDGLREPTDEEVEIMAADPQLQFIIRLAGVARDVVKARNG